MSHHLLYSICDKNSSYDNYYHLFCVKNVYLGIMPSIPHSCYLCNSYLCWYNILSWWNLPVISHIDFHIRHLFSQCFMEIGIVNYGLRGYQINFYPIFNIPPGNKKHISCKQKETIDLFRYVCPNTKPRWNSVQLWWKSIFQLQLH